MPAPKLSKTKTQIILTTPKTKTPLTLAELRALAANIKELLDSSDPTAKTRISSTQNDPITIKWHPTDKLWEICKDNEDEFTYFDKTEMARLIAHVQKFPELV